MVPDAHTEGAAPAVRRVEGRHGLAVLRASLPPIALVTSTPEGTMVRTPSRPDLHDGNVLDLARPPEPAALDRGLRRAEEQARAIGAPRVRLRWEVPLAPDAAPGDVPPLEPDLERALADHGLAHHDLEVLLLDRPVAPAPSGVELVGPLPAEGDAALDRSWHGVAVLQRYAEGDTPAQWRAVDEGFAAFAHGVRRALALEGRAGVHLAMRHGVPVATVTVVHDRAGSAVVEDLVVHPVHRGRGTGAELVHRAVSVLAAAEPGVRIGVAVAAGSASDRLQRRVGFRPHAVVRVVERDLDRDRDRASGRGSPAGGRGSTGTRG